MSILGIGGIYEGFEKIVDITVVSDSDYIDLENLNGDQDQVYILSILFKEGSGLDGELRIYPNGDTVNHSRQALWADSTTISANRATEPDILWTKANNENYISVIYYAKSGVQRRYVCHVARYSIIGLCLYSGLWNNTTSLITFLRIQSARTGGIGSGSRFLLYRKKG